MAESAIMKSLNGRKVYDEDARRELENIKNAAPGLVFDTVADMEAYIAENAGTLKVGQDLFIRAADVPDYWWDGTAAVPVETELGEVKRELTELSEAIDAAGNEVYVLEYGETLDDVPEGTKVVYEVPVTEEGEGGETEEGAEPDVSLGITGAAVDHVAQVAGVDTDGKPVSWKAVSVETIAQQAAGLVDTALLDIIGSGEVTA